MAEQFKWTIDDPNDNFRVVRKDMDYTSNPHVALEIDKTDGTVIIGNHTLGAGQLRLHEAGVDQHSITLAAPTLDSDVALTLPASTASSAGQALVDTDGSGTLGWGMKPRIWITFGLIDNVNGSTSGTVLHTTDNAENGQGYLFPSAVTVKNISVQVIVNAVDTSETLYVDLFKNGSGTTAVATVSQAGITTTGAFGFSGAVNADFSAGDRLLLKVRTGNTTLHFSDTAAIVELE